LKVLKYIWRAGKKGDVLEDRKKSRWYLGISDPEGEIEKSAGISAMEDAL
jgi:hypothetical protein